jgi:lipopolysaccharide/colanic/teichoic acid biosynthesis glycosyltransferase
VERAAQTQPVGGIAKRAFDVAFSVAAIAGSLGLFVPVAMVIWLISPGPILFRHERIGYQGRRFKCLKFRTMKVGGNAVLEAHLAANPKSRKEFQHKRKLRKDPRVIPVVGTLLRKTSLDELPQFINVLLGDMSVVGPRPVTREEVDLYGPLKPTYLSVRPGVTGLWQVSGRNNLCFDERVALDGHYVRNWSFRGDAAIILRTFAVLLNGRGAY